MNLSKQNIYITSANNSNFWNGYLNGLSAWGFANISRTVYDVRHDLEMDEWTGSVKTPSGYKQVSTYECPIDNKADWAF